MRLHLLFALLLFASVYAASVTGNFRQPIDPGGTVYKFNTDMQFTTDFTLSYVSGGGVVSGNPANLQTNDIVCSGSVLRVAPTTTARWATPSVNIVAWYPNCDIYGNCPGAMISSGGASTNRDIKWLSASVFNDHKTYGDGTSYSQSKTRYDQLATFHTQRMAYHNNTATYNNKEGEANVFCKGRVAVRDNGAAVGTSIILPFSGTTRDVTLSTVGSHSITTRFTDAACIAVAVKRPVEYSPGTWFYMSYYAQNQPTIPEATTTKTITVQNSGGTCNFHELVSGIDTRLSLGDPDTVMLKIPMYNDGDPIRITGVTDDKADVTVIPLNIAGCPVIFAPSDCPPHNGFNVDIAHGATRNVYVVMQRSPGASGAVTLTFSASTVSGACGGATPCTEDVIISDTTVTSCSVEPDPATVGTNEVAEFEVECRNFHGAVIPCHGSNWYWGGGLTGGFMEKTTSHALAYTTSPPGSSGTMNYESDFALCTSDVGVVPATLEASLLPTSADLDYDESKYFTLHLFYNGAPVDPDDAAYDRIEGLAGSLSNDTIDGVTYTAPSSDTDGKIRAFAEYAAAPPPIVGAVAFSSVEVANQSDTNHTDGGGDDDHPGSTDWCTITVGPSSWFPGSSGWVGIMCGEHANETCTNVSWSIVGTGAVVGGTDHGATVTITGEPGDSGKIWATVDNNAAHWCWFPFYVGTPECWEYT